MDTTLHTELDAQREIIRSNLTEIANDVAMMMRDAGLGFPVFLTVRADGHSLVTMATPVDPLDDAWEQASEIVCRIMEKKLGEGTKLRNRELLCAVANAAPEIAADVAPDGIN